MSDKLIVPGETLLIPPAQDEGGPPREWVDGKLRPDLPPLPEKVARLPVADNGYPVPWFVSWIRGKPEFRAASARKQERALKEKRCWVCGGGYGHRFAFVLGPMCVVNRINAEPPSHEECADFSAKACPFLSKPAMRRRENDLPPEVVEPPGHMIRRNPGVACVWVTRYYRMVDAGDGRPLFMVGDPLAVRWYAEGRAATRAEVVASIDSGLPALQAACSTDDDRRYLVQMLAAAKVHLPAPPAEPTDPAAVLADDGCPNAGD